MKITKKVYCFKYNDQEKKDNTSCLQNKICHAQDNQSQGIRLIYVRQHIKIKHQYRFYITQE